MRIYHLGVNNVNGSTRNGSTYGGHQLRRHAKRRTLIEDGPSDGPAGNRVGCPPSGGGCDSPQHRYGR
jgi:hypothetical protein